MNMLYRGLALFALVCASAIPSSAADTAAAGESVFTLVVQDPLAAPLSCPCVEGYAQRKYEKLGEYLEKKLGYKVKVVFSGSLKLALKGEAAGRADLIIGKNSVVRSDAKEQEWKVTELGHLTDKLGSTKHHGLVVVTSGDPAKQISDLNGYNILFGPADCDEKHAAAIELFTSANVAVPKKLSIDQSCSDGAAKVVDRGPTGKTAAVISSYAAPLLEGCGTIKKGDLRVVGKTKDVPFISAFATETVSAAEQVRIRQALLEVAAEPELCAALESLIGFVAPIPKPDAANAAESVSKKN